MARDYSGVSDSFCRFISTVFLIELLIGSIGMTVVGAICVNSTEDWCLNNGWSIAFIIFGVVLTMVFVGIMVMMRIKKW